MWRMTEMEKEEMIFSEAPGVHHVTQDPHHVRSL